MTQRSCIAIVIIVFGLNCLIVFGLDLIAEVGQQISIRIGMIIAIIYILLSSVNPIQTERRGLVWWMWCTISIREAPICGSQLFLCFLSLYIGLGAIQPLSPYLGLES